MTKVRKVRTAWDARKEKAAAPFATNAARKADERAAQEAADAKVLADNPHIGKLVRNGRPVYYVTAPAYREAIRPGYLLQAGPANPGFCCAVCGQGFDFGNCNCD